MDAASLLRMRPSSVSSSPARSAMMGSVGAFWLVVGVVGGALAAELSDVLLMFETVRGGICCR